MIYVGFLSQVVRQLRRSTITPLVGCFLLCLFAMVSATFLLGADHAGAAQTVPYKMNYQGRLANAAGTSMADGLYNMKFRLFSVTSGGSAVWTETRDATNRVQVTSGQFSVQLGDVAALSPSLFTSQPLYLEVELPTPATATCSTAACGTFTEGAMTPRQPLGSAAYAMNADTVDGIDGAALVQLSTNNTLTGTNLFKNTTNSTAAFQIATTAGASLFTADTTNSRIQIGAATSDSNAVVLVLDTKDTAGDPAGVNGAMYYNSNAAKFRCYENGAWANCITVNPITIVTLASDVVNNNATANTLADATGLSFNVTAGQTYHFTSLINYTAAAAATGSRWTINAPAATTLSYTSTYTLTATTQTLNFSAAIGLPALANVSSLTAGNIAKVEGIITPSASGVVTIQFASEIASSAITAKAGSTLTWW